MDAGGFRWSVGPAGAAGPAGALTALAQRYALGPRLGRGGAGEVWRARDPQAGRDVAIKVLLARADPARLERFRREAEVTARLRHPGIVGVHAAGEVGGQGYIVYALIDDARSLRQAFGELAREARVALVRDAARALGFAHAQGVVHRDVKVENLLVDRAGRVHVTDFGLAWTRDGERLTQSGALLGTPMTMAPEQIAGDRGQVGPPTDVWALGVILYEALTGALPFGGQSLLELSARIIQAAPPAPRALDRSIPADLEAVCLTALRQAPGERYPHGEALALDLDRALAGERVRATTVSAIGLGPRARAGLGLAAAGLVVATVLGAALLAPVPEGPPIARATTAAPAPRPAEPRPVSAPRPIGEPRPEPEELEVPRPGPPAGGFRVLQDGMRAAAEAGEPLAMAQLGEALLGGKMGFAPQEEEGLRWLHAAADAGDGEAMSTLGTWTRAQGRPEEAVRWYRGAAERGRSWAMSRLGAMLLEGEGCRRDPVEAVKWLRRDAEVNERVYSMRLLARVLRAGDEGVPKDEAEAALWERRAAEQAADERDLDR